MARNAAAHDEDFYAWTQEQARLLRSGEFTQLDIENVAEELEGMGRSDKRALESRLEVLLMHLLKWRVQIEHRSGSWSATIRDQRRRIQKLLRDSPSLRPEVAQLVPETYEGDAGEPPKKRDCQRIFSRPNARSPPSRFCRRIFCQKAEVVGRAVQPGRRNREDLVAGRRHADGVLELCR